MLNKKAFVLTELVIAMVIVAILSIISVVAYRGYSKRSILTEAKALLGEIHTAEQAYYYRTGTYYKCSETSKSPALGIDARRNKYFSTFEVSLNGTDGFTAVTEYGTGSLTLKGYLVSDPEIIDNYSSQVS